MWHPCNPNEKVTEECEFGKMIIEFEKKRTGKEKVYKRGEKARIHTRNPAVC